MTPRNWLPYSDLPPRLPLTTFAVVFLVLDRLNAPNWLWGICFAVCLLLAVGCIHDMVRAFKGQAVTMVNDPASVYVQQYPPGGHFDPAYDPEGPYRNEFAKNEGVLLTLRNMQ